MKENPGFLDVWVFVGVRIFAMVFSGPQSEIPVVKGDRGGSVEAHLPGGELIFLGRSIGEWEDFLWAQAGPVLCL